MKLKIDGKEVTVIRTEKHPDGWIRVYVRPVDATVLGPHSCHSVPQTTGKFQTGGHSYEFETP